MHLLLNQALLRLVLLFVLGKLLRAHLGQTPILRRLRINILLAIPLELLAGALQFAPQFCHLPLTADLIGVGLPRINLTAFLTFLMSLHTLFHMQLCFFFIENAFTAN